MLDSIEADRNARAIRTGGGGGGGAGGRGRGARGHLGGLLARADVVRCAQLPRGRLSIRGLQATAVVLGRPLLLPVGSSCTLSACVADCQDERLTCTSAATFSVHRRCEEAICEGGACVFERVKRVQCPGGACHFRDMKTTLGEGYCTGGGCKLEGEDHPSDFAATLSE